MKFTVLWVDKPTMSFSGPLSAKNAKRNVYKKWTTAGNFELKSSGVQRYGCTYTPERWGFGTEAAAAVHPPKFKYAGAALKLERNKNVAYYTASTQDSNVDFATTLPAATDDPSNDTGPDWARDDAPPTLFDIDAPGLRASDVKPENTVRRGRGNYKAFASAHVQGKDVVCSEVTEYFVVRSMKQTAAPSGSTWVQINDVTNDNKVELGTTKTTWDPK